MDKIIRMIGPVGGIVTYTCPECGMTIYDIFIDDQDLYHSRVNRQYCINCSIEMIRWEDEENDGK